ncbi:MAG: hypothetical protein IMF19_17035 [Proteobacteria bacterium]|nr:hypothetical protein [Pseudomonadota bacterium]
MSESVDEKMGNTPSLNNLSTLFLKGRVGALIEVGAGFHPLLTGRENVYINAVILEMAKEEVDEKFDDKNK